MDSVYDRLIPGVLFFLMLVVGMDLRSSDFERLVRLPRAVVVGTIGQIVLLPLLAGLLVLAFRPEPHIAAGLLLVGCCPAGAISNGYVRVSQLNLPLSVTLTVISSVLGVVALPILIAISFPLFLGGRSDSELPILSIAGQLALIVLLPVALGMAIRRFVPALVEGRERALRLVSLVLVLAAVVMVAVAERAAFGSALTMTVLAVAYTALASAAGLALGWSIGSPRADRATLGIEFAARNMVAALFIATTSLGQPRFAAFAAVFFVVQAPLVLVGAWLYMRRGAAPGQPA